MAFFYDSLSELSGLAQYDKYLENNRYVRNLKISVNDPLHYQLLEIKRMLGENTFKNIDNTSKILKETQRHFESLTTTVCGTIEKGFREVVGELEDVNWRLSNINEGISDLSSMLDWKTDIIIEGQRVSNLYLANIAQLLNIPNSQKERTYHIQQGIIWLKNAIEEGLESGFYTDALDEFTIAKGIEEKDYFCLNKIGIIYLYSEKHRDVVKACEYFNRSARFAKAVANATSSEISLEFAAASLNYASRCYYIQTKFPEAIELAKQAFDLQPHNPEFGMQLAKCLSTNSQEAEAANILSKVIEIDKFYSVKALLDPDFISKPLIQDRIEKIATDLINKVNLELEELKSLIASVTNNKVKERFSEIHKIFFEPTYLNARTVHDELSKKQKWEYIHYIQNGAFYYYVEDKKVEELTFAQIIRIESKEQANKTKFHKEFVIAEIAGQKKWKKHKDERLTKQIVLTIVLFIVGVAVWTASSLIDGWFYGFLIKLTTVITVWSILEKLFDYEEKTQKILVTIVIILAAVGAWVACTNVVPSVVFSFILKVAILFITAYAIAHVNEVFD